MTGSYSYYEKTMDPWNLWCRSLPIESKFQQNEISCPSIQPARCFMKSCSSIFVWSMLTKLSKINPMSSYRFFKMKTKYIFGSVMAAQARGNVNRHFYILRDLRIHEVESVYCVHRQSWTGPKSSQLAGAPAACRPHGTTHFPDPRPEKKDTGWQTPPLRLLLRSSWKGMRFSRRPTLRRQSSCIARL